MSDTSDSSYEASYETTSFDVSTTVPTYEATSYDATAYTESVVDSYTADGATVELTGSTSYDSTDWSQVAEVSEGYQDIYQANSAIANDLYQASVDAYLAGDDMAAYELNQQSIAYTGEANEAWGASNEAWTGMDQTTTVDSYTATYDAGSGYDASAYSAPAVDTTSYVDTSYTPPTSDSFINDVIYEGGEAGA